MPEILTRYPDVVIQVLRESGAKCGVGAPQQILTSCPPERFCSMPTGEVCVYGLNEMPRMTQITPAEIVSVASGRSLILSPEVIISLILVFAAGALLGDFLSRRKRKT